MSSTAVAVNTAAAGDGAQPTMEQKIVEAIAQGDQIVAKFSPVAAQLVAEGVAVEPLFSGMIRMFASFFHHHVTGKPPKA